MVLQWAFADKKMLASEMYLWDKIPLLDCMTHGVGGSDAFWWR
jgi:hypothetical protein